MVDRQEHHIGVSILVLDKDKKRLLLSRRLSGYKSGWFGSPGGKVEPGEKLEEAAGRELTEETGLRSKSLKYLGVLRFGGGESGFVLFVYLANKISGELVWREPKKHTQWKWFDLTETPKRTLSSDKLGIDVISGKKKAGFLVDELEQLKK